MALLESQLKLAFSSSDLAGVCPWDVAVAGPTSAASLSFTATIAVVVLLAVVVISSAPFGEAEPVASAGFVAPVVAV